MMPRLADTPVLDTPRFRLRAPAAADYPAWEAFFLSDRARFVGGGPEHGQGRAWRGFASIVGHWPIHGFGLFVLEDRATGAAVGMTGPWFPADWPERELGWSLWDPAHEGTGAMAEAVPVVLAHLFDDLGWETVVSYVNVDNTRSVALAHRLGAERDDAAARPAANDLVYRHSPRSLGGRR